MKAGNDCTRHPDIPSDLRRHTIGSLNNQAINFVITNPATGKQVAGPLCPGVTYSLAVKFDSLGSGHHLLTSTYGSFPDRNVCLGSSNACKNRACPEDEGASAAYSLTMPCTLPGGAAANGADNVIRASWGDGVMVNSNKVTYKFGGGDCKPCGAPPGAPPGSPSPSPSPRPASSGRLIVRASNNMPVKDSSITITVRLVGYTASLSDDSIDATLTTLNIPANATAALACSPRTFSLSLDDSGRQFVADTPITCRATAAGRARVRVALKTSPVLANTTAVVSVKLPM
uniref:Uncharacterized protein n=1 Tax=Tetradesmus obliquus TaxID=3088 RepID=A0A383VFV1_TETOB|eukprot:jgi/Sobl393_1/4395/SZX63669.1